MALHLHHFSPICWNFHLVHSHHLQHLIKFRHSATTEGASKMHATNPLLPSATQRREIIKLATCRRLTSSSAPEDRSTLSHSFPVLGFLDGHKLCARRAFACQIWHLAAVEGLTTHWLPLHHPAPNESVWTAGEPVYICCILCIFRVGRFGKHVNRFSGLLGSPCNWNCAAYAALSHKSNNYRPLLCYPAK